MRKHKKVIVPHLLLLTLISYTTGMIVNLFLSAGDIDRGREEVAGAVGGAGAMPLPSPTLTGVYEVDSPPRLADILVAYATIEG